jgi:hypothetical protein
MGLECRRFLSVASHRFSNGGDIPIAALSASMPQSGNLRSLDRRKRSVGDRCTGRALGTVRDGHDAKRLSSDLVTCGWLERVASRYLAWTKRERAGHDRPRCLPLRAALRDERGAGGAFWRLWRNLAPSSSSTLALTIQAQRSRADHQTSFPRSIRSLLCDARYFDPSGNRRCVASLCASAENHNVKSRQ